MERRDIYQFIQENNLSSQIFNDFHRQYQSISTPQLINWINENCTPNEPKDVTDEDCGCINEDNITISIQVPVTVWDKLLQTVIKLLQD
jgi:hypothetical protein